MDDKDTLTVERVRDLVMANRVIRAPSYLQDHDDEVRFADLDRGLQWGADCIPALLGLFQLEKDPRQGSGDSWVGFARHWRGDTLRLDLDLSFNSNRNARILVVTGVFGRSGKSSISDPEFGMINLPQTEPTDSEWDERVKGYQAARNKDESDGAPAVEAFIGALPGWKNEFASRIDELVEREVPQVVRAVKWHIPFYGLQGQGWFASIGEFSKYMKVAFICQEYLEPRPPTGTGPDRQAINLKEKDSLDEELIAAWIKQAAAKPGLGGV